MFKNFGTKFLLGFIVTSLSAVIINLLIMFTHVFIIILVFAVVAYAVGSLMFGLGFRYNEEGDLVRVKNKK